MKKISTLFKKDPNDLSKVINEVNPENQWVFEGNSIPTRKLDGTACAIIEGKLYKRYDVKKGKSIPNDAIPCQEPDEITGHWPHWIKCDVNNPSDKYHFEGFNNLSLKKDGTYELIGEKVQGNAEKLKGHYLVRHGELLLPRLYIPLTFYGIIQYLGMVDIEGIVFHEIGGDRMAKIRKSDFGIKR